MPLEIKVQKGIQIGNQEKTLPEPSKAMREFFISKSYDSSDNFSSAPRINAT